MFSIFSQRFLLLFYFSYSEMSSIVVVIKDLCTILTHYEIIRILYKIKISKYFSDLFLNNIKIKIFLHFEKKSEKKNNKIFCITWPKLKQRVIHLLVKWNLFSVSNCNNEISLEKYKNIKYSCDILFLILVFLQKYFATGENKILNVIFFQLYINFISISKFIFKKCTNWNLFK